ncbi:MAG: DUF4390 domain-containing protein [Xanthomonadales bacterium]|nr:DUF4390 domain-containing protein [Xanthomonadales bacterium]
MKHLWPIVLLLFSGVQAGELAIQDTELESSAEGSVFRVSSRFELTEPVQSALENAIPVTFLWQLRIEDKREFLPDEALWSADGRLQLSYRSLSRRYTVVDPDSGEERTFSSLMRALAYLQDLDLPLPPLTTVIDSGQDVRLRYRFRLDIGALPPPLRLPAYLSDDWRLDSGWVEARLETE